MLIPTLRLFDDTQQPRETYVRTICVVERHCVWVLIVASYHGILLGIFLLRHELNLKHAVLAANPGERC